jgi:hypothetical protein
MNHSIKYFIIQYLGHGLNLDPGCLQFWSSARWKLHINLKNWMMSAQSEVAWNIERIWKYSSELQYPFRFMVRILITILLRTVTSSSDAVQFSSVTICCISFMYLPEAWTERPSHISECYFTGGRMFWMVTVGHCRVFVSFCALPWHHKQCLHSFQAYKNFVIVSCP